MVLTPALIRDWLEAVKDPEVPVISVVELGVVRDIHVQGDEVTVEITPTYTGCPAMRVMEDEIVACLHAHGVTRAAVRTVFREPWSTAWMTDAAREKLRAYGIAPPRHLQGEATRVVTLQRRTMIPCPHCGSHDTVLRSEFGSTACKAIYACRECREPFDYFKAI